MAAALKQMDDVTECSICTREFTDPRVLPCVHTYCLKCIQRWSKDKVPGDKVSCPLCRKECLIPEEGVVGLPKNFFVEKMVHIRELLTRAEVQSTLCDMCTYRAEANGATKINSATTFCLECRENLCQFCAAAHRKQKMSRDHKLLQIENRMTPEDLYAQYPPAKCDRHIDETLKIYCNDCEVVICMMCYIKDHNAHKCSDINEVVDELERKLTIDADNVTIGVDRCKQMLRYLSSQKKRFNEEISRTEVKIRQKANQLKDLIDDRKKSLLRELTSLRDKRNKEMKTAYEEIERHAVAMECLKKYVCEIREKGTACDIARSASSLHDRADELLMFDAIQRTLDDFGQAEVTFTSPSFDAGHFKESVGSLQLNITTSGEMSDTYYTPELAHAIYGASAIYGVASLDNGVYVVRNSKTEVEVYDASSMELQQRLPVPKLSCVSGIAACSQHNCLYVGDWDICSVHRVDLTKPNDTKNWSVARIPEGLSVNGAHNVLVSCLVENKLQEYTTLGDLVKEVRLCMTEPRHAIQLSSGDYVVCQYMAPGVVSLVGQDGQVLRSFGQSLPQQGVEVEPMKYPVSLAVNKAGDILVADCRNNRILAINCALSRAQQFPIAAEVSLRNPYALWLDEAHDRLYVGEQRGRYRLLVFSNLNGICWKQ